MTKAMTTISGFGKSIENFFSLFKSTKSANTGEKNQPEALNQTKLEKPKDLQNKIPLLSNHDQKPN